VFLGLEIKLHQERERREGVSKSCGRPSTVRAGAWRIICLPSMSNHLARLGIGEVSTPFLEDSTFRQDAQLSRQHLQVSGRRLCRGGHLNIARQARESVAGPVKREAQE